MKSGSVPLATCERDFLLQSIRSRKRLDGRETYDYRKLRISFGVDRGHCEVQLGRTRVLGQVSCEVAQPKPNRPTEGQLFVNVELSPMASPAFESGRSIEFSTELNRFMERFYVESRAIDVESLCIVAGEKVWSVRVDLHVLDNGGNIADCASIAAITALAHFRRPDVSVIGEEVTIHSSEDRDPVPLSILHMPVCITFGFFDEGQLLLVDPTDKEEIVMNGRMIMAMNIHREICGAVMGGGVSLESDQILRCSKIASVKVAEIVALIQEALADDSKQRAIGKTGLVESDVAPSIITVTSADESDVDITEAVEKATDPRNRDISPLPVEQSPWVAELKGPGTAQIGEGGDNSWIVLDDDDDEEEMEDNNEIKITDVQKKPETATQTSQQKNGSKDPQNRDISSLPVEHSPWVAKLQGPGTAQIGEGGDNSWIVLDDDDEEEMEDNDEIKITDVQTKPETTTQTSQQKNGSKVEHYNIESDDSEEEDVVILTANKSSGFQKSSKPKSPQDAMDLSVALKGGNVKNSDNKKKKKNKNKTGNRTSPAS